MRLGPLAPGLVYILTSSKSLWPTKTRCAYVHLVRRWVIQGSASIQIQVMAGDKSRGRCATRTCLVKGCDFSRQRGLQSPFSTRYVYWINQIPIQLLWATLEWYVLLVNVVVSSTLRYFLFLSNLSCSGTQSKVFHCFWPTPFHSALYKWILARCRYTVSGSTWIGPGGNVTCTLVEEGRKGKRWQRSRSQPCTDLCKDQDHNRVSGRGMIIVLCHCSHVVRASINVWLC